jgi:hypothetical protein
MITTVSIPPAVRLATPFIPPLYPSHHYSLSYSLFQCDARKQPQNHAPLTNIEEMKELRKVLTESTVME